MLAQECTAMPIDYDGALLSFLFFGGGKELIPYSHLAAFIEQS